MRLKEICMFFILYTFLFVYWLLNNTTVKSPTEDPLFQMVFSAMKTNRA